MTLLLLACVGNRAPEAPARGKTHVVVADMAPVQHLLSPVAQMASDMRVIEATQLHGFRTSFDCGLVWEPGLYHRWRWNDDNTRLTVTLRDDITWSDDTPVTADDVRFAYQLAGDPAVGSPRLLYLENMTGPPLVNDDGTLTFTYTHAYDRDTMMAHANLTPVPRHALADVDPATLRGHALDVSPLVSGPLTVTSIGPAATVLAPNPQWTGPDAWAAGVDILEVRVLEEHITRLAELEAGRVDVVAGLLVQDVDRLRDNPDVRIATRGYRSMDYIGWNNDDPLFADPRVRTALTRAINVQGLIDALQTAADGTVFARQATSTVTPELCQVHADIAPIAFDPTEAARQLESLGWLDRDGDGVREDPSGQPFAFTLTTNTGNSRRLESAHAIQRDLGAIGVQVTVQTRETWSFFEMARERDYQAMVAGWSAGLFTDMTDLWSTGQDFNFTNYSNPQVDRLMQEALVELDPAARNAQWMEVQRRIYADQPYTFLFWMNQPVGINARMHGVQPSMLSEWGDLSAWRVAR